MSDTNIGSLHPEFDSNNHEDPDTNVLIDTNNEELDSNTILEDVYPGKTYNRPAKGRRILKLYTSNNGTLTDGYVKSVNKTNGNVQDHVVSGEYTLQLGALTNEYVMNVATNGTSVTLQNANPNNTLVIDSDSIDMNHSLKIEQDAPDIVHTGSTSFTARQDTNNVMVINDASFDMDHDTLITQDAPDIVHTGSTSFTARQDTNNVMVINDASFDMDHDTLITQDAPTITHTGSTSFTARQDTNNIMVIDSNSFDMDHKTLITQDAPTITHTGSTSFTAKQDTNNIMVIDSNSLDMDHDTLITQDAPSIKQTVTSQYTLNNTVGNFMTLDTNDNMTMSLADGAASGKMLFNLNETQFDTNTGANGYTFMNVDTEGDSTLTYDVYLHDTTGGNNKFVINDRYGDLDVPYAIRWNRYRIQQMLNLSQADLNTFTEITNAFTNADHDLLQLIQAVTAGYDQLRADFDAHFNDDPDDTNY